MNGWQRIGVLASVAWFIGTWVWVSNEADKKHKADWSFQYELCRDRPHDPARDFEQSNQCGEEATKYADIFCCGGVSAVWNRSERSWASWFIWPHQDQIVVAVMMIPLWWLLAYTAIWLVKWVKRGSAKSSFN